MATAAEQAKRNSEIVAAHAAGESVAALALRFKLSRSRVKQIVRTEVGGDRVASSDAVALARQRRDQYQEVVVELGELARRLPDSQASAKVGAYRALLDGLDRLSAIERALGFLPDDLGRLRGERAIVEAVLAVFVEHEVPAEARRDLLARLGPEKEAA